MQQCSLLPLHNLIIEVGLGRCVGPQLLLACKSSKVFKCYGQTGQPIYYNKLIVGCEENTFGTSYPVFLQQGYRKLRLFTLLEHLSTQADCLCSCVAP